MRKILIVGTGKQSAIEKGESKMERYVNLTEKEIEKIKRNMNAFVANFGEVIKVEKSAYDKLFYIYLNSSDVYRFYAKNIDTIDGWLYGCVMTSNGIVHK